MNDLINDRAASVEEAVDMYNNSVIEAWETVEDTAEVIGASLDGVARHDLTLEIVDQSDDDYTPQGYQAVGTPSSSDGSDCSVCQAHTPTN